MLFAAAAGALVAALVAAALAGAAPDRTAGAGTRAPASADLDLRVAYDDGAGARLRATLLCRGATRRARGFLAGREPRALCAQARRLGPFLARPVDPLRPCTLVYGGPERARITGEVGARRIDRRLARSDGCEIADWDRAAALLPPRASAARR